MKKVLTIKNLSLLTLLLCFTFFISCQNELEEEAIIENADDPVKGNGIQAKGPWQDVMWDDFGYFDSNKWSKTNRQDYNSWRCVYQGGQVSTGSWQGTNFLILRAEKLNNTQWKSGHVKSKNAYKYRPQEGEEFSFKARIKFNCFNNNGTWRPFHDTYGAWPAFWTVEEHKWPRNGEIDIMEGYTFGNGNNDKYASNLFFGWTAQEDGGGNILNSNQSTHYYSNLVSGSGGWTDFEMFWSKKNGVNKVVIKIGSNYVKTYNDNNVQGLNLNAFGAHNIILNLNIGSNDGIFQNWRNNVFGRAEMLVDYVHVRKRTI